MGILDAITQVLDVLLKAKGLGTNIDRIRYNRLRLSRRRGGRVEVLCKDRRGERSGHRERRWYDGALVNTSSNAATARGGDEQSQKSYQSHYSGRTWESVVLFTFISPLVERTWAPRKGSARGCRGFCAADWSG